MHANEENELYVVEESGNNCAMLQVEKCNALTKWHQRLGHLNFNYVKIKT